MGFESTAAAVARPDLSAWYTIERIHEVTGDSIRTLRRRLSSVADQVTRDEPGARGRPRKLYHYTVDPRLAARHVVDKMEPDATAAKPVPFRPIAADDMARAKLRMMAVTEYLSRCKTMSHQQAAESTCRDWASSPREEAVPVVERLPGNCRRKRVQVVSISPFRHTALRSWAALYKDYRSDGSHAALMALAPDRKGKTGRRQAEIDEDLLLFVYALANSTARADVQKAVEQARQDYKAGEFPQLSLSTWRRRLRKLDPQRVGKALSHSVSRFRHQCSPDVETPWNELAYNARWEVDDVQKDWYAHGGDGRLIRPYAYAVIRSSTRQWIALVTAETPITQAQIRTLVGTAMASPGGGIPGEIKFERGHTASDPHLEHLLNLLGVRVSRTSMDGGHVHPAAFADRATGHFQGKAVVEANFRRLHNLEWNMPAQVGTEERHSSPARTETLLAEARRRKDCGEFLIVPKPEEWHAYCRQTCERSNNAPHSGLPLIVDPQTGQQRHMTPNEMALHKRADEVAVMPEQYLMLFSCQGRRVPVTRNGFRLANLSYGRFDEELKAHQNVTVYVDDLCPEFAYVVELGRCVEAYTKEQYGASDQFAAKRSQEHAFRNRYEAAMDRAIRMLQGDGTIMVDSVQTTEDPTPDRQRRVLSVGDLDTLVSRMRDGVARLKADREAFGRRFEFSPSAESEGEQACSVPAERRRSLLATADRLSSAVSVPAKPEPDGGVL